MNKTKKVAYIDGRRLQIAIWAGAQNVVLQQNYLDSINVFPVPDKDTGTNMASTMNAILESLLEVPLKDDHLPQSSLALMSTRVFESSLMGARGNSGSILAQFFGGLAEGLQGNDQANIQRMSKALLLAHQKAREVISNPVEGTILSVMRDWADHFSAKAKECDDFLPLFSLSVEEARKSLLQTQTQLDALTKWQVVDAGAQGFVFFLEGILHFLEIGHLRSFSNFKNNKNLEKSTPHETYSAKFEQSGFDDHDFQVEAPQYQYCTECLVHQAAGMPIDLSKLRTVLSSLGDSLIVAGNKGKARIHLHTDTPGKAFQLARQFGLISQEKADDMIQQVYDSQVKQAARNESQGQQSSPPLLALITDSACDMPKDIQKKYNIHTIPVRVKFGEEEFIDKVTLNSQEFYQKLQTSSHHPKTSRPSPYDFKRCYEMVMKNFDGAISLHVPKTLSGTFQGAQSMAATVSPNIAVVDGCSASCGLGLLAIEASLAIQRGKNLQEVVEIVQKNVSQLKIIIFLNTMEYLVRGGRIHKVKGVIGKIFHLKPILTISPTTGLIEVLGMTIGGRMARQKMLQLLHQMTKGKENLRFAISHGDAPQLAASYQEAIHKAYPSSSLFVTELSPALGAHVGPGSAAIAFLGDDPLPSGKNGNDNRVSANNSGGSL